jgi:hypothetical protein
MKRAMPVLLALALAALILAGCGGKKMTDDDFVTVASTIYDNVRANWDHQANESWDNYYDRRIAEACIQYGFKPQAWDKKMNDVLKHPEKFKDKLDAEALEQLIQWQNQRLAARLKN